MVIAADLGKKIKEHGVYMPKCELTHTHMHMLLHTQTDVSTVSEEKAFHMK